MLNSVFKRRTFRQWIMIGLTTLVFMSLSGFCFWIVERNRHSFNEFTHSRLPSYGIILSLQACLSDFESSFFRFSYTSDEAIFDREMAQTMRMFSESLDRLEEEFFIDASALDSLRTLQRELPSYTSRFKGFEHSEETHRNIMLFIQDELSPVMVSGRDELSLLLASINLSNRILAENSVTRIQLAVLMALLLIFVNLCVLVILTRLNYARRSALKEQLRLASYARDNPNPVFAVNRVGEVIYQNKAAKVISQRWEIDSLLPDELENYLLEGENYSNYEYYKGGRFFDLCVSYLKEFKEYRIYLNDITDSRKAEEGLEYLAYHDPVTGLVNRQQFCEFVDEALNQLSKSKLTVAILDLDLFDKVVATAGMSVADKVARVAAIRLQRVVTREPYFNANSLSYIGGGLFCFAYPKDPVDATILVQRMEEVAEEPFDIDGFEFYLHLTIGMVSGKYLENGSSEDALRLADAALNLANKRGGRRVVVYESWIAERHNRRMEIEFGLRTAIQKDEFELYYQPKISLETGRVCGAEALLRWESQEGFISPAEFIPIAEETGQVMEIGQWVINQACKDVAAWNLNSIQSIPVAVNVSAMQLLHADVAKDFLLASERYDVPLSLIEAEVTETAVIEDFSRALEKLNALHDMGVTVSLDDFGTGYSSLSYLQRLPVDVLKVDRSFVQRLRIEELKNESLVETIIELAHQLGLRVVAEGVETQEQLGLLYDWECEYVQGYLFAKPMPLTDFLIFLNEFNPLMRPIPEIFSK